MRQASGARSARRRRLAGVALCGFLAGPHCAAAGPPLCFSDEGLFCHLPDTLALGWQRLDGQATHPALQFADRVVVGASGGLFAFSDTGDPRWRIDGVGEVFTPVIAGAELYAGTLGGQVLRIDAATGAVAWRAQRQGWVYAPAVSASAVVSGGRAGVLHALRRTDGAALWSLALDQELVDGPLLLDARNVLAWTFAGSLYKVDAEHGRVVWRQALGSPVHSAALGNGEFMASLFDKRIVALRATDGARLWESTLPERARLTIAGPLLIADAAEQVSVLGRATGRPRWQRGFAGTVLGVRVLDRERLVVFLRDVYRRSGAIGVRLDTGLDLSPPS